MTNNRDPVIANDTFAQCDECAKWVRVEPPKPDGSRSIPLRLDYYEEGPNRQDIWLCHQCYEKKYYLLDRVCLWPVKERRWPTTKQQPAQAKLN